MPGYTAMTDSNSIQSYSFDDGNATAKRQYYRLKIINTNGSFQYSSIQYLNFSDVTEILVFPNPTTNILQLQLNKNYSSMNVQIVNVAGQVIKQYNKLSTQNQLIQIPVKEVARGSYWLHLQGDREMQVLQFIKQ
jgi:Neuraminidase (sialidase)